MSIFAKLKKLDSITHTLEDHSTLAEYDYVFDRTPKKSLILISKITSIVNWIIDTTNFNNIDSSFPTSSVHSIIIVYRNLLKSRVIALIDNGDISLEFITDFTNFCIFKSSNAFVVKIGLILGEIFIEKDDYYKIIKVFSKDASFIYYLDSYINFIESKNDFLIDLATKSDGDIKLFAITNMDPILNKANTYIIENGFLNSTRSLCSVVVTLYFCDIERYLKTGNIDNVSCLVHEYLANCIEPLTEIRYIENNSVHEISLKIKNTYLFPILERKHLSLIEIHILILLKNIFFNDQIAAKLIEECLNLKQNINLVKSEISNGLDDLNILINLSTYYNIKLSITEFKSLLNKDIKTNCLIYKYFYKLNNKTINSKCILNFLDNIELLKNLDAKVINDDIFDFNILLKGLLLLGENANIDVAKKLAFVGIESELSECRAFSIEIFKNIYDSLKKSDLKNLKVFYDLETDSYIKDIFKDMLLNTEIDVSNEVIEVPNLDIICHIKDIKLSKVYLSFISYKNLEIIECNQNELDTLFYIVLDDDDLKVISLNGLVIGYLPENIVFNNLLLGGKILYGILDSASYDEEFVAINVYLSYTDVLETVSDIMNMIDSDSSTYLS